MTFPLLFPPIQLYMYGSCTIVGSLPCETATFQDHTITHERFIIHTHARSDRPSISHTRRCLQKSDTAAFWQQRRVEWKRGLRTSPKCAPYNVTLRGRDADDEAAV